MSRRASSFRRPSLLQLFEAPEDHHGSFGWLCGYSADAAFLDDAAERFTRQVRSQRANRGRIALALMLDPSQSQIPPVDAPGVLHLACLAPEHRPFRLLHAKLAFLGFRGPKGWLARLIVSTGNWTQQTLEDSLDLAWHIEIHEPDLHKKGENYAQIRSDIAAAWELLTWIRQHFDSRILDPAHEHPSESRDASRAFNAFANSITSVRGYAPRIFDNRKRSLLSQLPSMVKKQGGERIRNYLAMGSGFYEKTEGRSVPSVLDALTSRLLKHNLLTQSANVDVFVNPHACQGVAQALPAFADRNWTVRPASQPEFLGSKERFLHAKFVFSANVRDNSDFCTSAWVYLGSGNLTSPGFASAMSRNSGNLEVGVVFGANDLSWDMQHGIPPERVVTNLLPLQWDIAITEESDLAAGESLEDRDIDYAAPPVACLYAVATEEAIQLETRQRETPELDFDILDRAGSPCSRLDHGVFLWPEADCPRQVEVRWHAPTGVSRRASVPVVDPLGRVAALALRSISLDEAWMELEHFPLPSQEDPPLDGEDSSEERLGLSSEFSAGREQASMYPVRQMMMLVERIAAKQVEVQQADWSAWCTRLEQSLIQASDSPVVEFFRNLGIDPIAPLREPAFRPDFALTEGTPEGQRYEQALAFVARQWRVEGLRKLGEAR